MEPWGSWGSLGCRLGGPRGPTNRKSSDFLVTVAKNKGVRIIGPVSNIAIVCGGGLPNGYKIHIPKGLEIGDWRNRRNGGLGVCHAAGAGEFLAVARQSKLDSVSFESRCVA